MAKELSGRETARIVFRVFQQRMRLSKDVTPQVLRRNRNNLPLLLAELGATKGAELGVRAGDFSLLLCQGIPKLDLYCIDPWAHYGGFSQERQDVYFNETREKLKAHSATMLRMTSMDATNYVKDDELDFVYIDGDHTFNGCMLDLIYWSKKVRKGGIVAGHDYGCIPEVTKAVHAYTNAHNILPWYITREVCSTYFWVRP